MTDHDAVSLVIGESVVTRRWRPFTGKLSSVHLGEVALYRHRDRGRSVYTAVARGPESLAPDAPDEGFSTIASRGKDSAQEALNDLLDRLRTLQDWATSVVQGVLVEQDKEDDT